MRDKPKPDPLADDLTTSDTEHGPEITEPLPGVDPEATPADPISTDDVAGEPGENITQPADQDAEADGGDPSAADPLDDVTPADEQQERGPQGARGYDESGNVRPADTRADVLVVDGDDTDDDTERA